MAYEVIIQISQKMHVAPLYKTKTIYLGHNFAHVTTARLLICKTFELPANNPLVKLDAVSLIGVMYTLPHFKDIVPKSNFRSYDIKFTLHDNSNVTDEWEFTPFSAKITCFSLKSFRPLVRRSCPIVFSSVSEANTQRSCPLFFHLCLRPIHRDNCWRPQVSWGQYGK